MAEFLVVFRDMIEFPQFKELPSPKKFSMPGWLVGNSTVFPMFSMVFHNLTVQVTVEDHGSAVPRGFERHRSSSRSRVFALIARSAMRKPVAGGKF